MYSTPKSGAKSESLMEDLQRLGQVVLIRHWVTGREAYGIVRACSVEAGISI